MTLCRTITCKTAVSHDISVGLAKRSGGSGHIAIDRLSDVLGEKLTAFKISRGAAEDKIDISFHIAVSVIMAAIDPGGELLWPYKASRLYLRWREWAGKKSVLVS